MGALKGRLIGLASAFVGGLGLSGTAGAAEVVVQNDNVTDGSSAAICTCFVAGEHVAVWLTSPCDGAIVAIQVFWRSVLANQPQTIEDSIFIRNPGNYPTPGTIIETLEAPVMTDGVLNEFRYFDENQTIPINIPVTNGQTFVVDFVFFNDNAGTSGPSVVRDNGATPGANAIFAQGLGWRTNEQLGVQGDWFIRAVIDCDPQGACCNEGVCTIAASESACTIVGGEFLGIGTDCAGDPCPAVTGACCLQNLSCQSDLAQNDCEAMDGIYMGNGTDCAGDPCASLTGACCIPATGGCVSQTQSDCITQIGGNWQGPLTTCPDACSAPPACPNDLDGDDDVDVFDFGILASNFGSMVTPNTSGDYDGDGDVDVFDFAEFAASFGCTP